MNAFLNSIFRPIFGFLANKVSRRLFFVSILAIVALSEFIILGLARRTFVFYNINDGGVVVEDRMLKRATSREDDIRRYTEETLLGPVSQDLMPLFPRGTRLKSLIYRHGVVYADFSADAVLPPVEGGSTLESFRTLRKGIFRNFKSVKDVRFFIDGQSAFFEEFNVLPLTKHYEFNRITID
jgi:spore germination protein GerM